MVLCNPPLLSLLALLIMKSDADVTNWKPTEALVSGKFKPVLASWTKPFFDKKNRYCIAHGGRGSGKSYEIADILIWLAYGSKSLMLCGREYQKSIKESVHSLIKLRIEAWGLSSYFNITDTEIRCIHNGSRFIFAGLRQNIDNIKSIAGITHLWVEEGDTLSHASWRVIKPTIREEGSQIFITFNPKNKTDCIYNEFIDDIPPTNAYVVRVNWQDNKYFPNTLNDERLNDMRKDTGMYRHIWEGELLERSDVQVFHRDPQLWHIEDFEPDPKAYAYYGLDFGSTDPTACIRCYITDNILYITHEFYSRKIEIDDVADKCCATIEGFKRGKIIADSSRPDMISFMRRQGYNVHGSIKGKGSIEDGIAFIRSFDKVVIHSSCKHTIDEFNYYSYKIDARSGDITSNIEDAHNHAIDALRYALERVMKKNYADYSVLSKM